MVQLEYSIVLVSYIAKHLMLLTFLQMNSSYNERFIQNLISSNLTMKVKQQSHHHSKLGQIPSDKLVMVRFLLQWCLGKLCLPIPQIDILLLDS